MKLVTTETEYFINRIRELERENKMLKYRLKNSIQRIDINLKSIGRSPDDR